MGYYRLPLLSQKQRKSILLKHGVPTGGRIVTWTCSKVAFSTIDSESTAVSPSNTPLLTVVVVTRVIMVHCVQPDSSAGHVRVAPERNIYN